MRTSIIASAMLLAAIAGPAAAEVVDRGPHHFLLQFDTPLTATPEAALASVGEVAQWWDPAHTWSGDAANLTLPIQMGACLCEAMPDGTTFQHGRVTSLFPERSIGLHAPLGPLKDLATRAALVFSWSELSGGPALAMVFLVQGEGVGAYADAVDHVMGVQFSRWAAYLQPAST